MYQINNQKTAFESLPGSETVNHNFHPHYYPLACGDVYLVTSAGNITFLDRDSDSPTCIWNSADENLYPCYYRPVTGWVGTSAVQVAGSSIFMPIYCVEEWKGSHTIAVPSAMSEDCVVFMLNSLERVLHGSNYCVVFRRGVPIYRGCCDFRGVPYVETRNNSKTGAWDRAEGMQEYEWLKDANGKYLGAGVDRSKTWEWVNSFSTNINQNIINDMACEEYAVSDIDDKKSLSPQYLVGCLDCGENDTCDSTPIDVDKGEFAKHTIDRIWFNSCGVPEGSDCACVDSKMFGLPQLRTDWQWGAQICDLGAGYALLPIKNGMRSEWTHTWLGEITSVENLPGYVNSLNSLDQEALDSYQVIMTSNPDEEHNGINPVLRTGIQYNDCFVYGDDFYRYEFNGWKFHEDWRNAKKHNGAWALITPDMTTVNSAMSGCAPLRVVTGASVNACGQFIIININPDDENPTGSYEVLNTETGAQINGVGYAQAQCIACFLQLRVGNIVTFYGSNLMPLWSGTDIDSLTFESSIYLDNGILTEDEYYYLRINYQNPSGSFMNLSCCTQGVTDVQTSTTTSTVLQAQAIVLKQRFIGVRYIPTGNVQVIEGCNVVYDDVGILQTGIGQIANGLVLTGKFIREVENFVGTQSAYVFTWVDLVLGFSGEWAGLLNSGQTATGGDDLPNKYTRINCTNATGRISGPPFALLNSTWTLGTRPIDLPKIPITINGEVWIGMLYGYYNEAIVTSSLSGMDETINGLVIAKSGNSIRLLYQFTVNEAYKRTVDRDDCNRFNNASSLVPHTGWTSFSSDKNLCYTNVGAGVAAVWSSQHPSNNNTPFMTRRASAYNVQYTYNVYNSQDDTIGEYIGENIYNTAYGAVSPCPQADGAAADDPALDRIPVFAAGSGQYVYQCVYAFIYQETHSKQLTIYQNGSVVENTTDDFIPMESPCSDYSSCPRSACATNRQVFEPYFSCDNSIQCRNYSIVYNTQQRLYWLQWAGDNLLSSANSTGFTFISCCTSGDYDTINNVILKPEGTDYLWVEIDDTLYFFANGSQLGSWSVPTGISYNVGVTCVCGLVLVRGTLSNGEVLVPNDLYFPGTLSAVRNAFNIPNGVGLDVTCCGDYGLIRSLDAVVPNIRTGVAGYNYGVAVTPNNIGVMLADSQSSTCVLDDGTVALGLWSKITVISCDGASSSDRWYINAWCFIGSDGIIRTVANTYNGNPAQMVQGASHWVPFQMVNPERWAIVYKKVANDYHHVLLEDRDIIGIRCNFYNSTTRIYDGLEVFVENGALEQSITWNYTYPFDEQAVCSEGIMQDQCKIEKTINNYRLIQTESVSNVNPFMRYEIPQSYDSVPKISQRGVLTNTKYMGRYEMLHDVNTTGTYNDIAELEQPTRKSSAYGGENVYALMVNDREHIAKFDRVRALSQNYRSMVDVLYEQKLPNADMTRSVFSQNGHVMILDKDLGLIKINQWGQTDAL